MNQKYYIIPIFVPHLGCPHQCVFCNQRSISGMQKEVNGEEVKVIIEQYLTTFPKDAFIEVAFFGGSFTGIKAEKQKELLEATNIYLSEEKIQGIRISTRPDYISRDILKFLKNYGVKVIELGVQSMDNEVLARSYRGHSREDVINASNLIKEYNFKLGHQMMIGLPGDTLEKDIITARQLIKLKPDIARIYPVLVIKGTELEQMYIKGQYEPLNVKVAVEISKQILKLFKNNDINVIRLGLQVTENINIGKDVVAGPFHPAFKELVESELRFELISFMLSNININEGDKLSIISNGQEVSITVGHKRTNIERLYKNYQFGEIKVYGNPNMHRGNVVVNVGEQSVSMHESNFF